MASAFFTIPICEDDIKYLKFPWDGQALAFLAMPMVPQLSKCLKILGGSGGLN